VSKAFTREDDNSGEAFAPPRAPLPQGTQNYITPEGAANIKAQLERLLEDKRRNPDTAKSNDARIQYLQALVTSFVVVEPAPSDVVRFGSIISVLQNGSPETYRIVGVDEIDLDQNHISWLSPLARALMSRRVGDHIQFRAPSGNQDVVITGLR
jgi:transcription elongation factor GreB